jgi:hypothetical protein
VARVIVLSALLVVAALVLLLVGLVATDGVLLIWISIAASLTAGALLLVGILRQRRQTAAAPFATHPEPHSNVVTTSAAEVATAAADPVPSPDSEQPTAPERVEERGSTPVVAIEPDDAPPPTPAVTSVPAGDAADPDDIAPGDPLPVAAAEVFVLPGRPRYHLSGCRFLATHDDATGLLLDDAEAKGYTPCSTCRPR